MRGTTGRRTAVYQGYFGSGHPGVYREEKFGQPRRAPFETGVPAFLGLSPSDWPAEDRREQHLPILLSLWSQFEDQVGKTQHGSFLPYSVRGFFENGGRLCYVVPMRDNSTGAMAEALEAIEELEIDLVCAPDLASRRDETFEAQQLIVNHCEQMGDRFAVLDSRLGDRAESVWEQWSAIDGKNGALYYPWIRVRGIESGFELAPPCGHIAGVYARTDRSRGVHKAPANEVLEGVTDLECVLTNREQDEFNSRRVNCLRSFPGRGIRVWGARSLSGQSEWTYINVRRIFLTAVRWISWNMKDIAFEPNNPSLWGRIERELTAYFNAQYRAGAFKGATPQEAFYVKCDAETNPPELRESGRVATEIGLSPTIPSEFVVVRLIHGSRGVTISGPERPA